MRRTLALVLPALTLAAAGCGGSKEDASTTSASGPVTVQQTRVETVSAPAPGGTKGSGFDARAIYARDAPGVVTVVSLYSASDALTGRGAEGSGFVIDGQGEIATNAHVVTVGQGSSIHKVARVFVRFPDQNQVEAKIVGFDPNEDVALLKVDPSGLTLRPLPLGSSGSVAVGEQVAAIGSPFGEEGSLSTGIISASDRTIDSLTRFQISGAIQTDAAINHGNSGGPLVDASGSVLGINSQINSSSGDNSGVGFAIPIDSVKRSLDQLRSKGRVDYAYLGVSTTALYPQLAKALNLPVDHGAIIAQVVSGGPAEKAGLREGHGTLRFQGSSVPKGADVVVAVDGHPVRLDDDLGALIQRMEPGHVVKLEILRDGQRKTVPVTLGSRPGGG
jgi:S1-C subfamily serine protease